MDKSHHDNSLKVIYIILHFVFIFVGSPLLPPSSRSECMVYNAYKRIEGVFAHRTK